MPVTASRCLLKFYSTHFSRTYQTQKYPLTQKKNIIVFTTENTTLLKSKGACMIIGHSTGNFMTEKEKCHLLGLSLRKNKMVHDLFVCGFFS